MFLDTNAIALCAMVVALSAVYDICYLHPIAGFPRFFHAIFSSAVENGSGTFPSAPYIALYYHIPYFPF